MAATGLLGINPYQKGINLDITSKPANLAIQLEQREQAKREALDKSFMDYEKTLNPAGMRKQDQDIFLGKLAQAKQYYLQNRDKILNPAKYGAEFQSTYNASLREAQSLIGQSKQAAAEDKITQQHFIAQKDLNAPDGYADALALSRLPINDTRYKPLDITQFKFYKSHNPMEYSNKVYSKIPLSEGAPVPYDIKEKPGYFYTKTTSKIDPQYKNAIYQEGYNNYVNDEGLRKEINNTFETNKGEVARLEKKYSTKISTPQDLAAIYTWDLQPVKESTSGMQESSEAKRFADEQKSKRLIDYNKQGAPTTHLFDIFGSGTGLTTKNADIKDGVATKKDGTLFSGNIVVPKEQLPSDFSVALSAAGISKNALDDAEYLTISYKNGQAESVSSESLGTIDANQMARYQDALNKRIYGVGGSVKRATSVPKSSSNTSGKVIKMADFTKMSLSDRDKFLKNGGSYK